MFASLLTLVFLLKIRLGANRSILSFSFPGSITREISEYHMQRPTAFTGLLIYIYIYIYNIQPYHTSDTTPYHTMKCEI